MYDTILDNRFPFSFYWIQISMLIFFLFQLILRLLFICPHITDITEINPWAFPCGVFIFYKWENVITKSRLNWITGYCIVLFFEGLQLYCPHFACITSINLWALPRRVSTIYSRWENDVHLPFQSLSNLQMNRRPNIKCSPPKPLLMSSKFTIRLMYILGLIFILPGCSAHNEERKSGFPRTDNYISITPLLIRVRRVIKVWSFEMKPEEKWRNNELEQVAYLVDQ